LTKIAPSILSADFARLADAIGEVEAEADYIHVDVMDGHFVPNLTIGPPVVAALRPVTSLPLDCHLMVTNPADLLDAFVDAGADSVTIHIEAVPDPVPVLDRLAARGAGRGLALNPDTPFEAVERYMDHVDMLLVMTVHPGFGGQTFREDVLPKLEKAALYIESHGCPADIEVDGGIAANTVRQVVDAGADVLVAGSAIFGKPDPPTAARELRRLAREARSGATA
jgi:ribulose-phosphate 3-epimerase